MVTFVTAFLDLHESRPTDRTPERRMEFFRMLNETGVRIHLFVSPEYADLVEVTNGVKEVICLEDLDTYRLAPPGLPETRNESHDTRNFLILMNAKIELVTRAMDSGQHRGDHYAWIDFNIFHVLEPVRGAEQIRALSTRVYPDTCMYVPGCWERGVMWSCVNWRFCGGFFLGDVASLNAFYFAHRSQFQMCPHLAWEVNVWAHLEELGWTPTWYAADHNNRILDVPRLPIVASLTTIPPREAECRAAIDSLLHQVDRVYVAVSHTYHRFGEYTPPEYLMQEPYASKVTLCFGEDYGPASKYIGTTLPKDAWVFVGDDDQEYAPNLIERMMRSVTQIGIYQNHYESIKQKTSGGMVHGYVGNIVHSSVLNGLRRFPLPECARFVDDQWVSMYCRLNNVPVFPTEVEFYEEIFKVTENGHEKLGTHSLSGLGTRGDRVRELEEYFGVSFLDKKA